MVTLSCAHGDDQMVRLALRAVTLSCAHGDDQGARTVTLAMRTDANRR